MIARTHLNSFVPVATLAALLGWPLHDGLAQDAVLARADSLRQARSEQQGLGVPVVHRLAEDVYAITDLYHSAGPRAGVSAGIVFAPDRVIFIDAGMTISSGQFLWDLAAARMRGDEQVFLILTHHHSDHVFGMSVFKERGATIIAHRGLAEELKDDNGFYKSFIVRMMGWTPDQADDILGDVIISVPDQTIEGDYVLHLDGDELHLLYAPGHEHDELVVYHPRSRTVFAGDALYEGMSPNTRFGGPAEWRTWIQHLERLKELDILTIVPGHGKLSSASLIDENIGYLREILQAPPDTGEHNLSSVAHD